MNIIIDFVNNHELLVFILLMVIYYFTIDMRYELYSTDDPISVGGVTGGTGGTEDQSINISTTPTSSPTSTPTLTTYEQNREKIEPQLTTKETIQIWKQVVNPSTSSPPQISIPPISTTPPTTSATGLPDQLSALKNIMSAKPNLESVQSNFL